MEIRNILIAGAGMMGKDIAYVMASLPDCSVVLYDIHEADVISDIRESCGQLVCKGVITADELEERLSRILFTADIDSNIVKKADFVIEAVFEDMRIKREIFAALEDRCRADAIFCTNSSVMSPSEISAELRHRERFAGTHFWNPAHLIPLVEVIKSDATSDETADTVMRVLEGVGKKAVLCKKDVPGFIANRLQHALWREAFHMVQEGIADPATIDAACKYGPGLRWPVMGPMENSDLVGIELSYNIHNYILKHLADNHEPSPCLKEMLDRGDLGFKSGKGWQEWPPERIMKTNAELREHLINYNAKRKE